MQIKLPEPVKTALKRVATPPSKRAFDASGQILLIVSKGARATVDDALPYAAEINRRLARGGRRKPPSCAVVELPNARGTRVVVGFAEHDADAFQRQQAAREWVATARSEHADALTVVLAVDDAGAWA